MPQGAYKIADIQQPAGAYKLADVQAAPEPPPIPVTPVSAGGRGTGLDVRQSDEFGQGFASSIPFSGAETPDTWRGTAGRVTGQAALLAYPATKVGQAFVGGAGEALTLGQRMYAGSKELLAHATPAVKYELVKSGLEHVGVPAPIAIPVAIAISGYKKGAKPTAATTATAEAEASAGASAAPAARPVASPPVAPAPPAAVETPSVAPTPNAGRQWSPQQIRNEVGLAMRRSGVTLTEAQRAQADRLVAQGHPPNEVVKAVASLAAERAAATPAATAAATAPATATPPKFRLSAAEQPVYSQLRVAGKTHQEAAAAIEQLRAFAQQFGLPSQGTVRTSVAERNATGRWSPPK